MSSLKNLENLVCLIEAFICRKDISLQMAKKIEGAIASDFNTNRLLMDFADTLAQYDPVGRDLLYNYHSVKFEALEALKELWNIQKNLSM